MKIESIIKRLGGTKVPMGDANYHFKPETDVPDAPHVEDVTDESHIARFLSIPEGYKVVLSDKEKAAQKDKAPPPEAIYGSESFDPEYTIHGKVWPINEIINQAFTDSKLSVGDWNLLEQAERDANIESTLDKIDEAGAGTDDDANKDDAVKAEEVAREEAVTKYKEKFGTKPHWRWNTAKINEELAAVE